MHLEIDKNKINKTLYLVSTPIGNLSDVTLRALEVLKSSSYILCEDTRIAAKLINKFKIKSKLISYHKFNEKKNLNKIIDDLVSGKSISLISDAGTPLISDPGKILVNECIKNNIRIIPIPGASAVITSVSVSNFSDKFYFHGYISSLKSEIENEFKKLSKLETTIVFFVSSKKFNKIVSHLKKYFYEREIVICKEMTKLYEDIIRYKVKDLDHLDNLLKGELTIVLSDKTSKKISENLIESDKIIIKKLINKLSVKDITKLFSDKTNISKSEIYKFCIKIKNEN